MKTPAWYKVKGYYHITAQASLKKKSMLNVIRRVTNVQYVAQYAFYPLLHVILKQRRYRFNHELGRTSHKKIENGAISSNAKDRPIHYANHLDALIFSYYASLIQEKYDQVLREDEGLSNCITAYRKIIDPQTLKGKSTIHFAKEVFDEIKKNVNENDEVVVLAFDIKSFFSNLDHEFLKQKWEEILGNELPKDHLNVFNAATKFSFIYKNDFKNVNKSNRGRNYNEQKIAKIRNKVGINAFFSSPKDFREALGTGAIRIYKNTFKNKFSGKVVGIPQGLPISSVLANIYLLDFDRTVYNELVVKKNCYYRRYSDDIIVICKKDDYASVEEFIVNSIKLSRVEINKEKTEKFIFKYVENTASKKIKSYKIGQGDILEHKPLVYLGFEFYGYKTLIKSSNLSKFYRRMIYSVKSRCNRAIKFAEKEGGKPIIFKKQLFKIYRDIDLDKEKPKQRNFKAIVKNSVGEYRTIVKKRTASKHGNYFSYVRRAAEIMNEPSIKEQLQREKKIFYQSIDRHLNK